MQRQYSVEAEKRLQHFVANLSRTLWPTFIRICPIL